jgi:radial spoke head protein 4/6
MLYSSGSLMMVFIFILILIVVLSEWTRLPLIRPEHVTISRNLNMILTGNLESNLNCYPFFPGVEKHYLKAILVRITHGTVLVPKGLYKPNDENRNIFNNSQ